jgi:hypothetical protein
MAQREKKRDETVAERIVNELEKLATAASTSISGPPTPPLSFNAPAPELEPEGTLVLDKMIESGVCPVPPAEYLRLRNWLRAAGTADLPGAFSAILQTWLHAHGIDWPRGVFEQDLLRSGTGMHKEPEGAAVLRLRQKGWTDKEIAKLKYRELYAQNSAKARKKVYDAAKNYRPHDAPLEARVGELAGRMLGNPVNPMEDVEHEIYGELVRQHLPRDDD